MGYGKTNRIIKDCYISHCEKNWKNELEKVYIECETVDPYISQIKHFADVICRKVKPITDALEGKQNLKVALSILESSKKNCIVRI